MTINFLMNSISDAHSNKRIKDFEEQGFKVKVFGFDRNLGTQHRDDITILGSFTNTIPYHKRIKLYIKGIRKAFNIAYDKDDFWFYQGLDTALFAFILGKKRRYIYEECDLVHSNIKNRLIRSILEKIDKHIIKKSFKTILTSEGFIKYHYNGVTPKNVIILPNKLSREVTKHPFVEKKQFDPNHIKFAFIGGIRYESLISLAKQISRNFPNHEFHFYGYISPTIKECDLPKGENIFYHGSFRSPEDLPKIYSDVDIVVATYDISSINVRYAEPNKLYECIYFNCPIVVSKQTFLEEKVKRLGIGYSVNPYDETDVIKMVKDIESSFKSTKESISKISQNTAIDNYNINDLFK